MCPTWYILYAPVPSFSSLVRVHLLWQSGFAESWEVWVRRVRLWNASHEDAVASYKAKLPKALSMTDNVAVVFCLFLAVIITSLFIPCREQDWAGARWWLCDKIQKFSLQLKSMKIGPCPCFSGLLKRRQIRDQSGQVRKYPCLSTPL